MSPSCRARAAVVCLGSIALILATGCTTTLEDGETDVDRPGTARAVTHGLAMVDALMTVADERARIAAWADAGMVARGCWVHDPTEEIDARQAALATHIDALKARGLVARAYVLGPRPRIIDRSGF